MGQAFDSQADKNLVADGQGPGTPTFDVLQMMQNGHHVGINTVKVGDMPEATPPAQKVCTSSSDYQAYVEMASRRMFAPNSLGNIESLKHRFDCQIHSSTDVFSAANQALSGTGDIYNHANSPEQVASFTRKQAGGYSGIGMALTKSALMGEPNAPGEIAIQTVNHGHAAEKSGVQPGDVLLSIDGTDVRHKSMQDAANLITSGAAGSRVDLVVDRNGRKVEAFATREAFETPPVVHDKRLANGVVYLKIDSFFDGNEAKQLRAAIERNADARAFIVDVRGNTGGFVEQAIDSAEMFVKGGNLMTMRLRVDSPASNPVYTSNYYNLGADKLTISADRTDGVKLNPAVVSRFPYLAADRPVAVLTDQNTASAAEIFTGAVHETGGDTTIGAPSYGKGIAQDTIDNMPDHGSLTVTAARYYTPQGHWPGDADKHRYPLQPDRPVALGVGAGYGTPDDNQLNSAVAYINSRLQFR